MIRRGARAGRLGCSVRHLVTPVVASMSREADSMASKLPLVASLHSNTTAHCATEAVGSKGVRASSHYSDISFPTHEEHPINLPAWSEKLQALTTYHRISAGCHIVFVAIPKKPVLSKPNGRPRLHASDIYPFFTSDTQSFPDSHPRTSWLRP